MKFISIGIIASIVSASAAREKASKSGLRLAFGEDSQVDPQDIPVGCVPGLPIPVPGTKLVGDDCLAGCECFSARCDSSSYNPLSSRTCMELHDVGAPCNEHNDCLTNTCPWAWNMVCVLKPNGEPCGFEGTLGMNPFTAGGELSALCESGRCAFDSLADLFGTCAAKLADDESCTRDEDCVSGDCNIGWHIGFKCKSSALLEETNTLSLA